MMRTKGHEEMDSTLVEITIIILTIIAYLPYSWASTLYR